MDESSSHQITRILKEIEDGKSQSAADLLPLVYEELRELARIRMARENPGATLQSTALVHEAYLRLIGSGPKNWNGRNAFFFAAAEAMRRILIDRARGRRRLKRGGQRKRLPMSVIDLAADPDSEQTLEIDEAITKLESEASDAAAIVRLRFYAGLTLEEVAETLGVSRSSVCRDWTFARAWLIRQLGYDQEDR